MRAKANVVVPGEKNQFLVHHLVMLAICLTIYNQCKIKPVRINYVVIFTLVVIGCLLEFGYSATGMGSFEALTFGEPLLERGPIEPGFDGGTVPGPWAGEGHRGCRRWSVQGDEVCGEEEPPACQTFQRGVHKQVPRCHFVEIRER